jgi:hypothetical protein
VHIVGEHDQLVIDIVCPEQLNQTGGLRKCNIAVVVAVYEQNR